MSFKFHVSRFAFQVSGLKSQVSSEAWFVELKT